MRVSVIGHRKVPEGPELVAQIYQTVVDLIVNQGADTFYFGSKSQFNTLCFEIVTELQKKYPYVRRVYVRANYEPPRKRAKNKMMAPIEATKKSKSGTQMAVQYAKSRKKRIINLF